MASSSFLVHDHCRKAAHIRVSLPIEFVGIRNEGFCKTQTASDAVQGEIVTLMLEAGAIADWMACRSSSYGVSTTLGGWGSKASVLLIAIQI